MVACTKEGESGKVPGRESGLKNDLEFGKLKLPFSSSRPFVFAGSSNRLGVAKGNPYQSACAAVEGLAYHP